MHTAFDSIAWRYTGVYAYSPFHWCVCRQADVVKVEIAEARSEVMAPLSAASMESYTRAYPYLVKLHMLQASHPLLRLITYLAQILPLAKTQWHSRTECEDRRNNTRLSLHPLVSAGPYNLWL